MSCGSLSIESMQILLGKPKLSEKSHPTILIGPFARDSRTISKTQSVALVASEELNDDQRKATESEAGLPAPPTEPLDKAIDAALDSENGHAVHSSLTMFRTRHPKTQATQCFSLHLHTPRKSGNTDAAVVLSKLAGILSHSPHMEIELCVDIPEPGKGKSVAVKELLKDSPYDGHLVRDLAPGLAAQYGKTDAPAGSLSVDTLETILDVVQIDHLRLSAATVPASAKQTAPLLPVGKVDLFRAGTHVYASARHQLATLEIGPWIPVDTRGRFALRKWHVGRMVLIYRPPSRSRTATGSKRNDIVPTMLWDPKFGFKEMVQSKAGTSIILLTLDEKCIEHFRERMGKLCKVEEGEDAAARFDLFKRKMFFSIQPRHGGTRSAVLPVWSGEGEPLHQHHPECTCGDNGDETEGAAEAELIAPGGTEAADADADADVEETPTLATPPARWKGKAKDDSPADAVVQATDGLSSVESRDAEAPRQHRRVKVGEASSSKLLDVRARKHGKDHHQDRRSRKGSR